MLDAIEFATLSEFGGRWNGSDDRNCLVSDGVCDLGCRVVFVPTLIGDDVKSLALLRYSGLTNERPVGTTNPTRRASSPKGTRMAKTDLFNFTEFSAEITEENTAKFDALAMDIAASRATVDPVDLVTIAGHAEQALKRHHPR